MIKRMTGGGADFSFECVGDTGIATTALQSCSDVRFYVLFALSPCLHFAYFIVYKGLFKTFSTWISQGWGMTVTLGVPKVKPEVSAHYGLFLSGKSLKGTLFGGWKPKSDLPSLIEKYMNKVYKRAATLAKSLLVDETVCLHFHSSVVQEIMIDEFVTHNLAFDEINKAFDLMRDGKCLRCVLHMPK